MQDHPLIDLYVNTGDNDLNAKLEQQLETLDLDGTVQRTLAVAGIQQRVMLTLMITDDEDIKEMNQQYRNINKPTDVLSFPLLDKPLVEAPPELLWQKPEEETAAEETPPFVTPESEVTNLGDIVISWPTIERQAAAAGHSVYYELLYLLAHGVLHLVGYDDQTEAGYQKMIQLQQQVMEHVGKQV
ncbi:putative rRNA maturation factor [Thermosporothrix hazakensis]|jgi:probable rRNA maturation factor|uniref:Endoribonuclease YbeY n=2 Tax=Thermosporothrix TaxID=768650 RepID=A0A326UPG2_THEHA|nr:rRNA maturation RNase YbeY [Thermosporothrix hazakensis]PZW36099.1 putative rRNA maturation factor [Thermosporothrix hazakensis]BBH88565.1 endoribonuclease YbeY [Thermosporothrix sp. COM3]GCE46750.1 endoribonuclease YbeY [Thermosporothrix hazakensis]